MRLLMVTFQIKSFQLSKLINVAIKQKEKLFFIKKENEMTCFSVFFWNKAKMISMLEKLGFHYQILEKGQTYFKNACKKNVGVLAGMLLIFALYPVFSAMLFRVNIIGATSKTQAQIEQFVKDESLSAFTWKASLKNKDLSGALLKKVNDLAFASFMIKGSTLFISVKEKVMPDEMQFGAFLPLRATYAGIVEEVEVFQGTSAVKKGDFVREGEVLILPFVFLSNGSKKDVIANGNILLRCFLVESLVHQTYGTRMVRTGKKIVERKIAFLGKIVYHSTATNAFQTYEVVESNQPLSLGNLLPIRYLKTEIFETREELFDSPFEAVQEKLLGELQQKCKQRLPTDKNVLKEFFNTEKHEAYVKASYIIEFTERIVSS